MKAPRFIALSLRALPILFSAKRLLVKQGVGWAAPMTSGSAKRDFILPEIIRMYFYYPCFFYGLTCYLIHPGYANHLATISILQKGKEPL
ncbi:MAG: hypothetical protein AMJ79_00715 [Phycisphaerae bacterium SM23_30]|nr:MAG: hypothetical protein AMJ79_00715 [Phycisphaerae bacterium SM23_30]